MEHSAATVEKAIDVLFHLHERPEPWGVSDLGRALDLPKSSVHRLLVSLRRRGLVESDERGRYRPGIALLALGLGVLDREPLVAAARPVLESEAAELGETFFVVAARAGKLTVLDKVEGTGFLRAAPRVGSSVPVHVTAVGKLYLAHAPTAIAAADLQVEAARVVSERELSAVRRRGYAENLGEWIEGLAVLAAPVFAHGKLVGAITTALPTTRLAQLDKKTVAQRVVLAAGRVAARMEGKET
ncbi:MAG TPA: IclR family transcriptional regulator [Polyangiales bacterium]